MSFALSGSVGRWERGARNHFPDVETVQRLLTAAAKQLANPKLNPSGIDGKIARPPKPSSTIAAIETFQRRFMTVPDGLIELNGRTWRELLQVAGTAASMAPVASTSGPVFPFATVPGASWSTAPRSFGANRSNGTRAHAGCDLYFPQGTWIHAIKDGKVVNGPYPFYCQTHALEIDHGDFLARYGEIQAAASVKTGDKVAAGQRIAKVGHLVGIQVSSDMLHLELYSKSGSGPLTVSDAAKSKKRADGIPFFRRTDLIDPTPYLNQWKSNLPK